MSSSKNKNVVYIVGAGFSVGLGYPLTAQLLPSVRQRLSHRMRDELDRVLGFHYPEYVGTRDNTFPPLEEFLTALAANADLLPRLRPGGPFEKKHLLQLRRNLLQEIAVWFHEIYENTARPAWFDALATKMRTERAAVISFNWDLALDGALFPNVTREIYGLGEQADGTPVLLKPHGSLNWFLHRRSYHIKPDRRIRLWSAKNEAQSVDGFIHFRAPQSSHGHVYRPWIVPPTHRKEFKHDMRQHVWKQCVLRIGQADQVFFLGYSLPVDDWHARYILRCGFHDRREGLPRGLTRARRKTGRARIVIVNPDDSAAKRIAAAVGQACIWHKQKIESWAINPTTGEKLSSKN